MSVSGASTSYNRKVVLSRLGNQDYHRGKQRYLNVFDMLGDMFLCQGLNDGGPRACDLTLPSPIHEIERYGRAVL